MQVKVPRQVSERIGLVGLWIMALSFRVQTVRMRGLGLELPAIRCSLYLRITLSIQVRVPLRRMGRLGPVDLWWSTVRVRVARIRRLA